MTGSAALRLPPGTPPEPDALIHRDAAPRFRKAAHDGPAARRGPCARRHRQGPDHQAVQPDFPVAVSGGARCVPARLDEWILTIEDLCALMTRTQVII